MVQLPPVASTCHYISQQGPESSPAVDQTRGVGRLLSIFFTRYYIYKLSFFAFIFCILYVFVVL